MSTYSDKFSSGGATLKLTVTRESYSTSKNTSYLKCVLQITKNKSYSSYNLGGASISMTIAGTKLYSSDTFDIRSLSVGSTKTLATKYITVSHNSDGTRSVTCKASFKSGVSLGSASISDTYTCGTIPRASDITSAADVTLGNKCSVKWTPKSSSFRYRLKFMIGDWHYTTGYISPGSTSAYTYTGYTIPKTDTSLLKEISGATASMTVVLYTYTASGTSAIGNKNDKFTVTVPKFTSDTVSTAPTVGTLGFSLSNINYKDLSTNTTTVRNDILLKGKNTITVNIGGSWNTGTGATLSSYTISGPGFDSSNNSNKTGSFTSKAITTTGELSYTVTITDSRKYTASKTIKYDASDSSYKKLYCYDYYEPSITIMDAYRCSKDEKTGTYKKDVNGDYIYCTYDYKYAPVAINGKNTNDYKITFQCKSESAPTCSSNSLPVSLNKDNQNTYIASAIISDSYCANVSSTGDKKVFGAVRVANVRADGSGIAFGKLSGYSNTFEVSEAWDVRMYGQPLINVIHPVGSVLITSTNSNPSETLGGTWQLVNKSFKPNSGNSSSEYFTNSSNISSSSVYLTRAGNSIRMRLQATLSATIVDDSVKIGTFNYNAIGITSLPFGFYQYPCGCDDRDAVILCTIAWDTGVINAVQSVPENSSTAAKPMYLDVTFLVGPEYMLDEFCDEFHWKRTA